MLSKELEAPLNQAFRMAREQRHEFMTVEHLLLALLSNRAALDVLRACGADVKQLDGELRKHLMETVPPFLPATSARPQPHPRLSARLAALAVPRTVLRQEAGHRRQRPRRPVREREAHAAYLLNRQNVTRLDVVNYISHGISKISDGGGDDAQPAADEGKAADQGGRSPLESFAIDLNRQARRDVPTPSSAAATRSIAPCRSSAGGARTTRCWWATRGSARPPLRRDSRG